MGRVALGVCLLFLLSAISRAQNSPQDLQNQRDLPQAGTETGETQRPAAKELYAKLDPHYKEWLDEDVAYIITPEERIRFLRLLTNEERDRFIEQFWQRRNPDPNSPENVFKREHYRRLVYADEYYSGDLPGWKTDRGKIYILFGSPDRIDTDTVSRARCHPQSASAEATDIYPSETWHYRQIADADLEFRFADSMSNGDYTLCFDPAEIHSDGTANARSLATAPENQNNGLRSYFEVFKPSPADFKDLEDIAASGAVRDQLKFKYRFDFIRVTAATVLVPISIEIPKTQMTFVERNGVDSAKMSVLGRITTLTGRAVETFEGPIEEDVPAAIIQRVRATDEVYQKQVLLSPGFYALDLVLKDTNSGKVGLVNTRLAVPQFNDGQLNASSLILADQITPVSPKDIGPGEFAIGDIRVRPNMNRSFSQNEELGIFLQIYNLKLDDETHKSDVSVRYRVTPIENVSTQGSMGTEPSRVPMLAGDISRDTLSRGAAEMTLEDKLPLGSLPIGKYQLQIIVTDNLGKKNITSTAVFAVQP
jgi:GWxTD domain-containing protein